MSKRISRKARKAADRKLLRELPWIGKVLTTLPKIERALRQPSRAEIAQREGLIWIDALQRGDIDRGLSVEALSQAILVLSCVMYTRIEDMLRRCESQDEADRLFVDGKLVDRHAETLNATREAVFYGFGELYGEAGELRAAQMLACANEHFLYLLGPEEERTVH